MVCDVGFVFFGAKGQWDGGLRCLTWFLGCLEMAPCSRERFSGIYPS